jgi:hypothetical protein
MSSSFLVAARRPIPASEGRWCCEWDFEGDEDLGLELDERPLGPGKRARAFARHVAELVKFTPAAILVVSPEWSASEAVARALATALDGAVFSELLGRITFDARGAARACASREVLEAQLRAVFETACQAFVADEATEAQRQRALFAAQSEADPQLVAEANDWSEVGDET